MTGQSKAGNAAEPTLATSADLTPSQLVPVLVYDQLPEEPDQRERPQGERLAIDGGVPTRSAPWPTYDKGAVFVHQEDEEAALRAIRSHLYFRYDCRPNCETECGKLESALCCFFGSRHALAVSSGTAALALAIMAARIPPDSLIACPGFTFAATPSSIILAGCRPFLVEVDENLHLDLADLRRRWTPEVKAIVVVHMRGFAADMDALTDFAAEVGVPVFEDAVPALGAELDAAGSAPSASPAPSRRSPTSP